MYIFIIFYFTKFKEDLLQKSYDQLSEQFGESKRVVKDAVIFLEKLGVIERVFRNKKIGGTVLANVMYIKLNVDSLKHLTFDEPEEKTEDSSVQVEQENNEQNIPEHSEGTFTTHPCPTNVYRSVGEMYRGVTEKCIDPYANISDTHIQPMDTGVCGGCSDPCTRKVETSDEEVYRGLPEKRQTYTENTTKITGDITQYITSDITSESTSDHQGLCRGKACWEWDYIRQNIRYDERISDLSYPDRGLYAELGGYIRKFFSDKGNTVRVNRENKPYEVVKSVFMKLDEKALCKVVNDYHGFEGTVERREAFFLTALYNAVVSPNMVRTGKQREDTKPLERQYSDYRYAQLERVLTGGRS